MCPDKRSKVTASESARLQCQLQLAIEEQDYNRVKELVRAGVDLNDTWSLVFTPLETAIDRNNIALFDLLIQLKADVNRINCEKGTPLHQAVRKGSSRRYMVSALVKQGASIDSRHNGLYWGAHTPLQVAVDNHDYETVKTLLGLGADVNVYSDLFGNKSLVHRAIENNDARMVYTFFKYGVPMPSFGKYYGMSGTLRTFLYKVPPNMHPYFFARDYLQKAIDALDQQDQISLMKNLKKAVHSSPVLIVGYFEVVLNSLEVNRRNPLCRNQRPLLLKVILLLDKWLHTLYARKKIQLYLYQYWNLIVGRAMLGSTLLDDCGYDQKSRYIEVLAHLSSAKTSEEARILMRCCYTDLTTNRFGSLIDDLKKYSQEAFEEAQSAVYARKYSALFPNKEYLGFIPQSHPSLFAELFDPFSRVYFWQNAEEMREMAEVFRNHGDISGELFWLAKTANKNDEEGNQLLTELINKRGELPVDYHQQINLGRKFKFLTEFYLEQAHQITAEEDRDKYLRYAYEYAVIASRVFDENLSNILEFQSNVIQKSVGRFFSSLTGYFADFPKGLSDYLFDSNKFELFKQRFNKVRPYTSQSVSKRLMNYVFQ